MSEVHKSCEADRIETGASDEESVDLRLRQESLRILGFYAAAV